MQLKKHKKLIVSILILVCVISLILAYFFNHSINTIVNIIVISFILAYTLSPIRDALEAKLKVSKRAASIIVIAMIIGIIITCIIVIVPDLFNEIHNISNIFDNINSFLEEVTLKYNLNNSFVINVIYNQVLEKGNAIWISFSESAVDNLIKFSDNIISFAIIPIMIYYFLCDGSKIYNKSLLLLPTEKRAITKKILKDIDSVLTRYIASQLLLSGVVGVLTFVLLLALKVKFPLWISILNAILNIIPYFGPIFGAIPAVIVALLDSPVKALWVIVGMFVIQQLEGDILAPKMTGDSTDMHPFVIIILLITGDNFGGLIGMVLVVPIAVIIKVLYDDINYYLF
ncbi:AI-2E family transporter [Clostridium gelidum]|uniref:AI-2E family transporter n=1 Tax=Clostridium gelidum TaxID=704125 RepID=A0ABM7T8E6_9CLOT|nr:AI-2E family transporter [Clostridium gelidum]BCZ48231.1 AI-2E family transporter [Clostridium gelidum]